MMKLRFHINRVQLFFSRWSRKGYAIFAALGREICISRISIGISEVALLKSARQGRIVHSDPSFILDMESLELLHLLDKQNIYTLVNRTMCAEAQGKSNE